MTSLRSRPARSMRSPRRSARAVSWRLDVAVIIAVVTSAMNPQSPSRRYKVADGQRYSKGTDVRWLVTRSPRAGMHRSAPQGRSFRSRKPQFREGNLSRGRLGVEGLYSGIGGGCLQCGSDPRLLRLPFV